MSEITPSEVRAALDATNKEYTAISWKGFNLFGDAASIKEVQRLMAVESRVDGLERRIVEQSWAMEHARQQEEILMREKWI